MNDNTWADREGFEHSKAYVLADANTCTSSKFPSTEVLSLCVNQTIDSHSMRDSQSRFGVESFNVSGV